MVNMVSFLAELQNSALNLMCSGREAASAIGFRTVSQIPFEI